METATVTLAPTRPFTRLKRWSGIFAAYFTTQTVTQLAGIAAGLLVVRALPVREFALYTLAASVIGLFAFVTDLGSTTSLLHFFHREKQGPEFGAYRRAVLSLRRGAFLLGALAVLAAFPVAAATQGFAARESLLVTAGILICVWFQIDASLRLLTLRLQDRYGRSYRAELSGALLRLGATALLAGLAWLEAWLAVLAAAAGTALAARLAAAAEPAEAGAAEPEVPLGPYRRRVIHYLLPTLPSAFYFALRGPLTVWLAAAFGAAQTVAEVGALGRLGLIVGLLSGLIGVVFLPRLSRIDDDRLYLRRCLQFGGLLAAMAAALLLAAWAAPRPFLWLLGERYAGLDHELLLVVATAGVALIGGYVVTVNLARSWTRWQALTVVVEIGVLAACVAALPLSTSAGVLTLGLLCAASGTLLQMVVTYLGFRRPAWVYWHRS
jgi:O-antigen/teichoic acid export membrane protein